MSLRIHRGSLFEDHHLSPLRSRTREQKKALRLWNRQIFGHVKEQINERRTFIESLQALPQTEGILQQEESA